MCSRRCVSPTCRAAACRPVRARSRDALERLIDRYLILQQIKATQSQMALPTPEEVKQQVDTLRGQIPQCGEQHCETDAGWRAFLAARGLTEKDVDDHWQERILILAFIQSRFGAGIRISQAEIEDYYQHDLVAEFARRKLPPPPLADVSSRIQEILLQQHINTFLQEWLQSLKQEGSVSILGDDPSAPRRAGSLQATIYALAYVVMALGLNIVIGFSRPARSGLRRVLRAWRLHGRMVGLGLHLRGEHQRPGGSHQLIWHPFELHPVADLRGDGRVGRRHHHRPPDAASSAATTSRS